VAEVGCGRGSGHGWQVVRDATSASQGKAFNLSSFNLKEISISLRRAVLKGLF
jgi:hypothetical protein